MWRFHKKGTFYNDEDTLYTSSDSALDKRTQRAPVMKKCSTDEDLASANAVLKTINLIHQSQQSPAPKVSEHSSESNDVNIDIIDDHPTLLNKLAAVHRLLPRTIALLEQRHASALDFARITQEDLMVANVPATERAIALYLSSKIRADPENVVITPRCTKEQVYDVLRVVNGLEMAPSIFLRHNVDGKEICTPLMRSQIAQLGVPPDEILVLLIIILRSIPTAIANSFPIYLK